MEDENVVATCPRCRMEYGGQSFPKLPLPQMEDDGKTLIESRQCGCGARVTASKGASLQPLMAMAANASTRIRSAGIKCPFCGGVFVMSEANGVESHSDPPCPEYTEFQPRGTFLDRAGMKAGWKRG